MSITPSLSSPPAPPSATQQIDVIGRGRLWMSLSLSILLVGLVSLVISWIQLGQPLRLGLDFAGGTLLDVRFSAPTQVETIRSALQPLGSAVVQLDTDTSQTAIIRLPALDESNRLRAEEILKTAVGDFQRNRVETVGPTVGRILLGTGINSLLISFALIMVYLGVRFQLDYAVFAIVALLHDVLLTVGIFSLLGLVAGVEVDSLFIVALLTIIGFSVNDTVVIYDRIRENLRLRSRKTSFADVVNLSLNQTFARSINTTLTTMLPLVAIVIFGGSSLKVFALALLVGFSLGAYSSICIASTLLVWWRNREEQRVVQGDSSPEGLSEES
ncbi:MAG: protein translocase subunit SecF [Synechococcales cyanobacterium]